MPTPSGEIADWFMVGCDANYSHMIIVSDMHDGSEYPIYATDLQDFYYQLGMIINIDGTDRIKGTYQLDMKTMSMQIKQRKI